MFTKITVDLWTGRRAGEDQDQNIFIDLLLGVC